MGIFKKKYERILVIPDLHIPAHHRDAFAFLKAVKNQYDPDAVVFLGDIVDFHSMSYHEHDPDLASPVDELTDVRKYVKELSEIFPEAYCIFGNHDKIIHRKATTAGLPKAAVRELSEIINSPHGWTWSSDLKLPTIKGDIYFTHGKTQSINKLAQTMGMSCCQGHYHSKYYVSYYATPHGLYFDANFGCLIDKDHKAFLYGEGYIGKPVLGVGIIKEGRAIPVPMRMAKGGRWLRKL
jgi:predicted phosphodiesterase